MEDLEQIEDEMARSEEEFENDFEDLEEDDE